MTQQGLISVDGRLIHLVDFDGIEGLAENGKLMD
jgi:hypothetical protein